MKKVHIIANLPEDDFRLLKELSISLNISMTDVIRRGIRDEQFFREVRDSNGDVLVQNRNGSLSLIYEKT